MCYPCLRCGKCDYMRARTFTKCPRCKAELNPKSNICPECGWVLPKMNTKKPAGKKTVQKKEIAPAA